MHNNLYKSTKKIDNNIIDVFYQEFHNSPEKDKK